MCYLVSIRIINFHKRHSDIIIGFKLFYPCNLGFYNNGLADALVCNLYLYLCADFNGNRAFEKQTGVTEIFSLDIELFGFLVDLDDLHFFRKIYPDIMPLVQVMQANPVPAVFLRLIKRDVGRVNQGLDILRVQRISSDPTA